MRSVVSKWGTPLDKRFGTSLLITGCGQAETAVSRPVAAPDGVFPVTIEHEFGRTEITIEPQCVLSLGYSDHDSLLAIGVTPIAIRYWFAEPENGVWAWAQPALGGATPELLGESGSEISLVAGKAFFGERTAVNYSARLV
ncbi:MAG: hypothetical protein AAF490_24500 [Chloroflexota bacterium]